LDHLAKITAGASKRIIQNMTGTVIHKKRMKTQLGCPFGNMDELNCIRVKHPTELTGEAQRLVLDNAIPMTTRSNKSLARKNQPAKMVQL
jgi:hypothetical protein